MDCNSRELKPCYSYLANTFLEIISSQNLIQEQHLPIIDNSNVLAFVTPHLICLRNLGQYIHDTLALIV